MKNPKTILIIIVTFISSLYMINRVHPQSITESLERELLYSETFNSENTSTLNNEVFLEQLGDANISIITQNNQEFSSNSVSIRQFGFSEEIILKQLGSNNNSTINQFGSGNTAEISKIGNSISSSINQKGSGHSIQLEIGTDKTNYNIQQQGYNHSLIDVGFNPNGQGYTIQQSGLTGMEIIIQHR